MPADSSRPWVVLKFGGTSVSSPKRWETIATVLRERLAEGLRPPMVCSALSGVTNQLEQLLDEAVAGKPDPVLAAPEERHGELGAALGVKAGPLLARDLAELHRLASGASLLRDASPPPRRSCRLVPISRCSRRCRRCRRRWPLPGPTVAF